MLATVSTAVWAACFALYLGVSTKPHLDVTASTDLPLSETDDLLSSNATDYLASLLPKYDIQAVSIAIAAGPQYLGESSWTTQFLTWGGADVKGSPTTANTLFSIGSNSKLFVVAALGLLIERRVRIRTGEILTWSTKIKDIFPEGEWQLQDNYAADHADLTDLLNMRSGMARNDWSQSDEGPRERLVKFQSLRPSTEFRQAMQYNNYHYLVLSHIVTMLTGVNFPVWVHANIIKPLGMDNTFYNLTEARASGNLSDAFLRSGQNLTLCAERYNGAQNLTTACVGHAESLGWFLTSGDALNIAGEGGVISCAKDMATWLRELLSPHLLPPETVSFASTPITTFTTAEHEGASQMDYGAAQMIYNYRGHNIVGHSGNQPGQMALMVRVPKRDLGVMIMINDDFFGEMLRQAFAYRILDDLLNLSPWDWEGSLVDQSLSRVNIYPKQVQMPRPPPDQYNIAASYHHTAIGTFQLEPLTGVTAAYDGFIAAQLSDILANSALAFDLREPLFLTRIDTIFVKYMLFSHFDGPIFNWTLFDIYPSTGFGVAHRSTAGVSEPGVVLGQETLNGPRWTGYAMQTGSAVFEDSGIGMFGDFWSSGERVGGVSPTEHNVRRRAEVYFDRV